MKNFEKYENEIKELNYDFAVDKKNDKVVRCEINCCECLFGNIDDHCGTYQTKWLYEEYKEPPILNEVEKAYLESFLKPFKDKIQCISKYHNSYTNEEYLMFCVVGDDDFNLPNFKKGTMYKGIELYKEYTLKELGLFEGIEK